MSHRSFVMSLVVLFAVTSASAEYSIELKGTWPKTWPSELEPLRERSQTFEGGEILLQHFAIPFEKREDFESAWPHLLSVKTPGAPILLRAKSENWLSGKAAGVCVHVPPRGQKARSPKPEDDNDEFKWTSVYIELVVDGEVIDLNRILLPRDTPIIDERFKSGATSVNR